MACCPLCSPPYPVRQSSPAWAIRPTSRRTLIMPPPGREHTRTRYGDSPAPHWPAECVVLMHVSGCAGGPGHERRRLRAQSCVKRQLSGVAIPFRVILSPQAQHLVVWLRVMTAQLPRDGLRTMTGEGMHAHLHVSS